MLLVEIVMRIVSALLATVFLLGLALVIVAYLALSLASAPLALWRDRVAILRLPVCGVGRETGLTHWDVIVSPTCHKSGE